MAAVESPAVETRCIWRAVMGAALLTLAVTLLRFVLEGLKAPDWLASRKAGGGGALIGISWLPLIFGPWFVTRIRTTADSTWSLLKRLLKVLVVYGWASRVPVVVITLLAIAFRWDTHFSNFGENGASRSFGSKALQVLGAQLIFWSLVWTPIVGGVAGMVFHLFTRRSSAPNVESGRSAQAA